MAPNVLAQEQRGWDPPGSALTRMILDQGVSLARSCRATAILVYADVLLDGEWEWPSEVASEVIFVTKTGAQEEIEKTRGHRVIRVPDVPLTRLGQVKMAVLTCLTRKLLHRGDRVVCLSGIDESQSLDTILVMDVGHEFEFWLAPDEEEEVLPAVRPAVVERVLAVASALGAEGREGRPVGALFVVGDSEHVLALSRQLILNPFKSRDAETYNILDPRLEETSKEFSTIDGAFIIGGDGTIPTCGAYLKTSASSAEGLPQGLGARHHAAAGITAATDSLAVTVSESTGTVTMFRKGHIVMEVERPRSIGMVRSRSRA